MIKKLVQIEKLKNDIYNRQSEKLGDITTENLKNLGYSNTNYMVELDLLEQQKTLNQEYIDVYNKEKSEFDNTHNTEKIINSMNETFNNDLNILKTNY